MPVCHVQVVGHSFFFRFVFGRCQAASWRAKMPFRMHQIWVRAGGEGRGEGGGVGKGVGDVHCLIFVNVSMRAEEAQTPKLRDRRGACSEYT